MKIQRKTVSISLMLAGIFGPGALLASPAMAQRAVTSRAGTRSATELLFRISQSAGVTALADSSVAKEVARLPDTTATAQTVEQQIDALVKQLPAGTTWVKLYLPPAPQGLTWRGDDVAAYVAAQARLFGKVGAAPPDTVEILGQRLPAEKAKEQIIALNLKPVYLITNSSHRAVSALNNVLSGLPVSSEQWLQMTPEQQKAYGQQQAQQIFNMPPQMRQQVIEQIQQHDHMFDSIKDPLEKLLGHDL